MTDPLPYSNEPENPEFYTEQFDRFYARYARLYDLAVKFLPLWRNWIGQVLPNIQGQRILEVSFGTGYLLGQYDKNVHVYAVEYNREMIRLAKQNTRRSRQIAFVQADVSKLPYPAGAFDTVVNTMAFSGYPDGKAALREMLRVIRKEGKLLIVDVNFPLDRNWAGMQLAKFWMASGDILRDMALLFQEEAIDYSVTEIGGWGSVHLYVARKTA